MVRKTAEAAEAAKNAKDAAYKKETRKRIKREQEDAALEKSRAPPKQTGPFKWSDLDTYEIPKVEDDPYEDEETEEEAEKSRFMQCIAEAIASKRLTIFASARLWKSLSGEEGPKVIGVTLLHFYKQIYFMLKEASKQTGVAVVRIENLPDIYVHLVKGELTLCYFGER